jgi:hypothetical protein
MRQLLMQLPLVRRPMSGSCVNSTSGLALGRDPLRSSIRWQRIKPLRKERLVEEEAIRHDGATREI